MECVHASARLGGQCVRNATIIDATSLSESTLFPSLDQSGMDEHKWEGWTGNADGSAWRARKGWRGHSAESGQVGDETGATLGWALVA